jgi:diacylglycerol kinase family enzyme
MAAIGAWHAHKALAVTLVVNGREASFSASQLLVANGVYYGGGNLVAPDASFEDGLLDVQLVGPDLPAHALLRLARALRRGEMADQPETLCFRTTRLEVRLGRPAPVNMDGELAELGDRLVFEVVSRALRVVVPEGE